MSSLPNFFYSPRITQYSFGPNHPLKPERLRRTIELLGRYGVVPIDPGPGSTSDVLRVHSEIYVEAVEEIGHREAERQSRELQHAHKEPISQGELEHMYTFGIGTGDVPAFPNMHEVSLDYVSSVAQAAKTVRDGSRLAFGIGGGLHHAHRNKASGFCVYDDPAIALHILREKFDRVAYVDIDVHHGDGVQWIWFEDPTVLTISIHEEGKTLFPGTGWVDEVGENFSALNIPLQAGTTGDVWLWAFENTAIPALERFAPQAIVLQMGTDAHITDPLAHFNCRQQEWLAAVKRIKSLGIPIVAVGGGGYNLDNVPRMWASACLKLGEIDYEDALPSDLAASWRVPFFSDHLPEVKGQGKDHAEQIVAWLVANHQLLAYQPRRINAVPLIS